MCSTRALDYDVSSLPDSRIVFRRSIQNSIVPVFNMTIDARFDVSPEGRLKVRVLDPLAPGWRLLDWLPSLIGYRIRKAEKVFRRIAADHRDVHYFQKVADGFRLDIDTGTDVDQRVPREGSFLAIANHPLNGIDGMAIAAVMSRVRPDLKVMLTTTFEGIPDLRDHAIFVNASNGPSARNRSEATREALAWLKQGHPVLLFPAGQGSFVEVEGRNDPVDVPWNKGITTFLKCADKVLPIYVEGRATRLFLKTRRLYAPLSTLFLLREILIHEGARVRFRVGEALTNAQVTSQGAREQQVEYLRKVTYALKK